MISSRLIKSNNAAAGCVDIVDAYDPFDGNGFALYQLNGNANDVSTNYDGTWSGTAAYTTGVFGQAANFVGGSTYINTNIDNELQTSVFSYSLWFNASVIDSTPRHLIARYSASAGAAAFWSRVESGRIDIGSYGASGSFLNVQISGINTNTWYNIVAVYNGSDIKYYLNGEKTGTIVAGVAAPVNITTVPIILGQINGYIGTYPFVGSIDQVRIFNTALTPLEVEALYTEELCICGGTVDTLDILEDSSCIALYPLDGNANDLSGNYSGTPTAVSYGVGEFDLAGVFNGSSGRVQIPSLFPSSYTSSVSFSCWFKTSVNDANLRTIIEPGEINSSGNFTAYYVNGVLRLAYYNLDGSGVSDGGTNIADGNWHNLVAVLNNLTGNLYFYLDGNSTPEISHTFTSGSTINTFSNQISHIGAAYYQPIGYFRFMNGSIDQVRIFNKALNSTEVTTLYNETACTPAACVSGTTNTLDILGDGSCIATYTLDGTPADLSGNYNGVQTDANYSAGKFDLGLYSNGTSTRINTNYIQNGQVFSVSFWGKNFGAYGSLIRDTPAAGGANTRINIVSNGAGGIALAGNYAVDSPTTGKTDWTHYVVTASGSVAKIYENTVEVASVSYSQAGGNNGTPVCIFSNGLYPLGNGAGQIDQVRIFNKALSAGEVTTLYNETPCN